MLVIGVSGGSGSGKTSFIRDLKTHFNDEQLASISIDEYYKDKAQQFVDANGVVNYDLPTAIDMDKFLCDVEALIRGEVIRRKEYTFNNDLKEAREIVVSPASILVVEGLFIYHNPKLTDLIDLSIIVHASDIHKIIRRIKRDQIERNYPLDDVLYRYQYHVKPSYDLYIKPYMEKVDVVVNNNDNYNNALTMLVGYLKSYLLDIQR